LRSTGAGSSSPPGRSAESGTGPGTLTSGRLIIDDARDYLPLFQIDRVFGPYGSHDRSGSHVTNVTGMPLWARMDSLRATGDRFDDFQGNANRKWSLSGSYSILWKLIGGLWGGLTRTAMDQRNEVVGRRKSAQARPAHARSRAFATFPCTSVRRISRPLKG
jgi:hypothetical protein